MQSIFILSILCRILTGPSADDRFTWLAGTWSFTRSDGVTRMEIWDKSQASTMSGRGLKVNAGDTLLLEHLVLETQDGQTSYIATVPDQNQGRPVAFPLVKGEDRKWLFENPAHDFPQRIIYQYRPLTPTSGPYSVPGDTMMVRVEDLKGDGFHLTFLKQ